MKKLILALVALAASAFAQRSETVAFLAALSPQNEVPAVASMASGTALLYAHVARDAQNQIVSGSVDFVILYTFPEEVTFTGLHIHAGGAGVNGPVTVNTGIAAGANAVTIAPPFRGVLSRQAQVLADNAAGVVNFDVNYTLPGDSTITGLHIHTGAAGVNGPVIFNTGITGTAAVTAPSNGIGNLIYPVEVNASAAGQVAALEGLFDSPGDYYINLHTSTNPGGLIRSQMFNTEAISFRTMMSPANEVPAVTGLNASAMGNALIYALRDRTGNVTAARFIFDVNYRFPDATTFTGLHIHDAAAGVNGAVSINSNIAAGERAVVSPGGFGNIWRPVNLVGGQPLTSLNSLLRNPENHYLNLHTTVHAGGAVRAQLAPAITRMPRIVDVISAVSDSRLRTLAPGGQFTIFGEDLAKVPTALGGLVGLQLPRAANGTSVTMGGIPVPIITLGFEARNNPSGYIVGQVPFEAPAGTHDVIVTSANGASNRFQVTVAPVAPAMFFDAVGAFAVRVADFSIVRPESAARAGETIAFVTTGLGQTMPMLATGQIPDAANLVAAPVTLSIGGRDAMVMGATTIPGYPGIYIVLANIPTGVAPGPANVMLRVGTVTANVTSLAVR